MEDHQISEGGFPFKTMKKLGKHSGTGRTINCSYFIVGDTKVLYPQINRDTRNVEHRRVSSQERR